MTRYIIGYGWHSDVDIIEAASLDEAEMKATERSLMDGLLDDDLSDSTWAEPYSDGRAYELGLFTPDEPRSKAEAWDRANPKPWR